MKKPRVLIVENDGIIAMDIRTILERKGMEVAGSAASCDEALRMIGETRPDIVLLDIMLDGVPDGIDAAERVRSFYHLPFIYLTAHTDDRTLERAAATGPYGYIVKPVRDEDLYSAVITALRTHGLERTIERQNQGLQAKNEELQAAMEELEQANEELRVSNDELAEANWKLRESEERFRQAFLTSMDYFILSRFRDGLMVDVNDVFTGTTGYGRDEVIGKTTIETGIWCDPADRQRLVDLVAKHGYARDLEAPFCFKDGTIHRGLISSKLFNINGEPHLLSVIKDIERWKKAEDALRASEEKYQLVVEHANEGIGVVQDNSLKYANPKLTEIFGYPPEELGSIKGMDVIHPEDRQLVIDNHAKRLRGEAVPEVYSFRVLDRAGRIRWVEVKGTLVQWEGRPAALMFLSDITERKAAEETIRASLREKEMLIREVHHRVKNNFQIIVSLLNLQMRQAGDQPQSELLRDTQTRIRAMALIHEKLYRSADLANIDFAEYVRLLVAELKRVYVTSSHGISVRVDAEDVLLGIDQAIPCGLIINELVTNAMKYAFPEESGTAGDITVMLRRGEGDSIELAVSDTGMGMPDGIDPLRAKSLGLNIVNLLAKNQLGGDIHFDGGPGTSVTVRFKTK